MIFALLIASSPSLAAPPTGNWTEIFSRYNQKAYSTVGNTFVLSYEGWSRFESAQVTTIGMHETPMLNAAFRSFLGELCAARGGDGYEVKWVSDPKDVEFPTVYATVHCTPDGKLRGYHQGDMLGGFLDGCFANPGGPSHTH